jgi:hypothetical protein
MAAWKYGGGTISAPGDPEYVDGREISADLFAVLGSWPPTTNHHLDPYIYYLI